MKPILAAALMTLFWAWPADAAQTEGQMVAEVAHPQPQTETANAEVRELKARITQLESELTQVEQQLRPPVYPNGWKTD